MPPRIYGVENGAYYNSPVTLQFDEGTATLNGEAFASGTKVDISGSYTLVVTDAHGLISTVSFNVVLPTTSAGGGSTASASSSGGGGGGSSSASSVAIVYSTPPEPVVLPQPKPQILGVKYGTSTQLAVAKIKLKANGTLIKDSQLRVYVIVGGQKKIISSLAELKKYKNKKIFSVVDAEAALYPDWRPYAVGVLLKTKAGETYLTLKDGTKLLINSTTTLKLMAKVRSYKNVSAVNLAYYPMATFDLSELSKKTDWRPYSVGVILKAADGTMYLTKKGGILHKITNAEELKKYKRYKTIQNVSAEALAFYSAE